MDCFNCKKDCVMKTEKYMDSTPCSVCERGVGVAGEWCKGCLMLESVCNFLERVES